MHNSIPRKTCFPAEYTGQKALEEVGPSPLPCKLAHSSSDPVLYSSHFFQARAHTLPNLWSSGNWATETKQGLWPDTSLANICEGQKTYVPNSLDITVSHIFCSGSASPSPLALKYLFINCWEKHFALFLGRQCISEKNSLTGCNKQEDPRVFFHRWWFACQCFLIHK